MPYLDDIVHDVDELAAGHIIKNRAAFMAENKMGIYAIRPLLHRSAGERERGIYILSSHVLISCQCEANLRGKSLQGGVDTGDSARLLSGFQSMKEKPHEV